MRLPRIHAFELEDQPWFPALLRDAGTAYLRLTARIGGHAAKLAPPVAAALAQSGRERIVDLCSGAGGPLPSVVAALGAQGTAVQVLLTDRFPATRALADLRERYEGRIDFVPEPVDATAVPEGLRGMRTLFNAFHHFRPDAARAILQSAVDAGEPILVAELLRRRPAALLALCLAPLFAVVLAPALRPFRLSWLVLSWLLPVIPLFVLWDGLVSALRIYEPDDLRALIAGVEGAERYRWRIEELPMAPGPVPALLLVGIPRAQARRSAQA